MQTLIRRGLALATGVLIATAGLSAPAANAADPAYKVLVFSKTAGFRHDSIAAGIQAIRDLGATNNFTVTATEDSAQFSTGNLAQFNAVVFLNTTGDVLTDPQQVAFESYLNGGGGYVGVHAAADTEHNWPFYGQVVGAWFKGHPAVQQATVNVEDRAHAATAHLGQTWVRTDEWYNYRSNPRATAHVLSSLNEGSYSGGDMGDHPITWCHPQSAGRSFYTGLGHTQASYAEAAFRTELLGGIRYAAGMAKADCRAETGYTAIFNGSTTGWSQAGSGSFTSTAATLTSTGGPGVFWYSAKEYFAYSLKLDWKLPGDDDSGVFVGFPSSDPSGAGSKGYEVQIDATNVTNGTTGSIWGAGGVDVTARDAALNPPGSWNTFELLVEGERLQVLLNGVKINDFTNTDPVRSLQQGHLGLQNNGAGDDVSYRNVRIKPLGGGPVPVTSEAEAFTSQSGIQVADHTSAGSGKTAGAGTFSARVSSAGSGRRTVRLMSVPGGTVDR